MFKISKLEHLTASKKTEVLEGLLDVFEGRTRSNQKQPEGCSDYLKYLKTPSQVLDACRTRLRRAQGLVRPGTAGLLIDIECSRVRDSSWMYLTSFVTIRIGIELAAVQRKLLDCVVIGFQLYSARTFHVNLSPGYIRAGRDPLQTIINT